MKRILIAAVVVIALIITIIAMGVTQAQAKDKATSLLIRLTEDNDAFGDLRKGMSTDEGYTNGSGVDILYTKHHKSKFFIDRWMPKAGDSSINNYGISGMQVMYTPSNSFSTYYQPGDYSFASALYFTHTLYSYNPQKKYSITTALTAGAIGPIALGKPMQQFVHKAIKDPSIPQGWDNQFNNDVLLNASLTAEKEIAHINKYMQVIVNGHVSAGTMLDAIDIAPVIVFGKMNPYFNGVLTQYSGGKRLHTNKLTAYLKLKPGIQLVGWNSMLQGGMLSRNNMVKVEPTPSDIPGAAQQDRYAKQARTEITNVVVYQAYSIVIAYGPLSMSYTQMHTSPLIKNTYSHTYGNISISYSW